MINKQRVLDEFFELVKISSPTREERQIADVLTIRLKELGLTVTEDTAGTKINGNCGNLVAMLAANKENLPTILFSAHMDCVSPCLNVKPQLNDGVITSDGTTVLGSDDKAGIVAILESLRLIKEQNIAHGNIQVVFSIAEEGGLNGSKNLDKNLLKADYGYVLDSSGGTGKIIMQAPGQNKLNVKVHGKAAHAGLAPETGINAIVAASHIITKLPQGRIDAETTCNIGVIKGGTETNIVPDLVEINIETRSLNLDKLGELTEKIKTIILDTAKANEIIAEVEIVKSYDPFTIDKDAEFLLAAKKAIETIGLTPLVTSTGGGSDANFYYSYGVPCVVLSVGMQKVHTKEEFILEKDLYDIAAITLEIVKNIAK